MPAPSIKTQRLFISALLLLASCASAPRDIPKLPNIVILYTDDQGWGDCSALNPDSKFATPNMDRLAREGLVFVDGHSAGSVCTPSRYALLTGRYAWRTALGDGVLGADADCLIEDGRLTLASLLKARGYSTAIFGKWHLGLQIPGTKGDRDWSAAVSDGPLQKGFDTFFGLPASMNFGALTWFENDRATSPASHWTRKKFPASEITTAPLDYRMAPPYDRVRSAEGDVEVSPDFADVEALKIITDHTIEFLESRTTSPLLAYVALTSPHLPHCTAPEFRGVSAMGNYGDFMTETDHRIGQILDALDREGMTRDTIVILTSDNGPENNYKDWSRIYGHESSGPYRGGKRDLYEGGHRVPLLVRWPQVISPGTTSRQVVGQVDLLATVAEIVGVDLKETEAEDSLSFLPLLKDPGLENSRREPLVHQARGRFAIREGRWKLHFAKSTESPGQPGPPKELFDLDADPGESDDLLRLHPEVAQRLSRLAQELIVGD